MKSKKFSCKKSDLFLIDMQKANRTSLKKIMSYLPDGDIYEKKYQTEGLTEL